MQATPLPANEILEFFCGVGGDIRHFVFEYCALDVLASFGQTSWLCHEAVQEYIKGRLSFFLTPFVAYGQ